MAKFLILATDINSTGGIQRYTRLLIRTLVEMGGPNSVRTISYSPVGGQRSRAGSQKSEGRRQGAGGRSRRLEGDVRLRRTDPWGCQAIDQPARETGDRDGIDLSPASQACPFFSDGFPGFRFAVPWATFSRPLRGLDVCRNFRPQPWEQTTLPSPSPEEAAERSLSAPVGFFSLASFFLRLASCLRKVGFVLSSVYHAAHFHPDLVICNHIALAPVALILKRLFGLNYLLLAYGIEVWRNVSKRLFDEAAGVIAISDFTAHVIREKHGVDQRKIQILRAALDPELVSVPAACTDVISRHQLQGKRILLTVSRMMSDERYKGHEVVLQSLIRVRKVIPDLVYLIVGDGDDRERLERLAQNLGLQEAVVFAGSVSDRWLPAYYQACDAFIMPSRTEDGQRCAGEGFGIVYVEAAFFGKPAIAGKYGGSAEAVEDGVTGILVNPTNVDEVAEAITTLFTNHHLRQTLGQQAKARALREFTLDRFRKDLESILSTSTPLVIGRQ